MPIRDRSGRGSSQPSVETICSISAEPFQSSSWRAVKVAGHAIAAGGDVNPAKKVSLTTLHPTLAGDDPLAVVPELALADIVLEHRGLGLLHPQEQRFSLSRPNRSAIQARVPTLPTPTTFPGEIRQPQGPSSYRS